MISQAALRGDRGGGLNARHTLLLRFARLTAESGVAGDLFPRLIDACVVPAGVGAAAAAVLKVGADGRVRVAVSGGLPPTVSDWSHELESLDAEVGQALRVASGELGREVRTFPLVSGRDIYGALVIFSREGETLLDEQVELAEGLADLVALAMDKAAQYEAVSRSYAELRSSREALAKSEKLRALGEMAAGISHDLKNILTPLGLQTELLRRRILVEPHEVLEDIDLMDEAIRAGVDVVERLRDFSRQAPEPHAEVVDPWLVLTTVVELCKPRSKASMNVRVRTIDGGAPAILARRSELVTALVNLFFNSVDALTKGGTIVLRTGASDGGGWIEVDDDGPGMPEDVLKRVFQPFFTTKAQGTGLGLAMVYAFVKRHHGNVTLESAIGRGTRVRLWFPAAGTPR